MAGAPLFFSDDSLPLAETLNSYFFATRIARPAAAAPPGGDPAPADFRDCAEQLSLLRSAATTFAAPAADAAALAQAATDFLRAGALRQVAGGARHRIGRAPALLAAAGVKRHAALPAPGGAAPERDLLLAIVYQ
jgi:hypothetical protein